MPIILNTTTASGWRYLDADEANEMAAELPGLTAWAGADAGARDAALVEATADVDAAMSYQGRRLDGAQPLQFPRVWREPPARRDSLGRFAPAGPADVWDWDAEEEQAVVPLDVRKATLYQADAILAGVREPRLEAQHDGVVYELIDGSAESYKQTPGPGVPTGLCRRAWMLMRKYRVVGARME